MAKKSTDGREWIYVVEVGPPARVKVGRTVVPRERLATHAAAAQFGGLDVVQAYTALCADSKLAEFELIARIAACPGVHIVNGREMFTGIPFMAAARIADDIATEQRRHAGITQPPVAAHPLGMKPDNLIADCVQAFGDDDRLHLVDLCARLGEIYPDLTVLTLGSALRDIGIRTINVRIGHAVRKGLMRSAFPETPPAETGETG